ncbi:hypothetical protein PoB_004804300 [Plakobranchus ocellatus]|uniref:Uncharacterized protein n=1 Tax=Plakobranchus ocellatus TaxID=259542 RepID=A0AAV4BRS6_9GAST|nr:hypothetical protein PoB_004804300 [Plakobranchus ocellatus]
MMEEEEEDQEVVYLSNDATVGGDGCFLSWENGALSETFIPTNNENKMFVRKRHLHIPAMSATVSGSIWLLNNLVIYMQLLSNGSLSLQPLINIGTLLDAAVLDDILLYQ